MFKICDDKKLMNILEEIKKTLPEEKVLYHIEGFTFNEYRSRKNLTNKREFNTLEEVLKAFNKSKSKYKKIYVKISNIGYVELTKIVDIISNREKSYNDDLPFGYTICYSCALFDKKSNELIDIEDSGNFIEMYNKNTAKTNFNVKTYLVLHNIDAIELN